MFHVIKYGSVTLGGQVLSLTGMMSYTLGSNEFELSFFRSKHWHQLDHVLADKKARQFINVTKIDPTADCYTDHKLPLCKCCIVIKKKRKKPRRSPKSDTIMNEERREKLENFLDEQLPDCKGSWENLKVILQRAAKHVFDKRKRKGTDWSYDQEESIRNLLKDKKLNGDRQALRNEIRKLKNE